MTTKTCPICGNTTHRFQIDEENLQFLTQLQEKGILDPFITVSKHNHNTLKNNTPTSTLITMGVDAIQTSTNKEFKKLETQLTNQIQQTLAAKIPDPEQLNSLNHIIPEILLQVQTLLRKEQVSNLKGQEAEQELYEELTNYYPHDQITHLGKSGETDITITPIYNGVSTNLVICVESKKNSKWSRSYIDQLRGHMKNKASLYGILAVETMPSGADFYLTETHPEGTVFVTSRDYCKIAYGALRAVITSDTNMSRRQLNLEYALKNHRVQKAIKNAYTATRHLETIRKQAKNIARNADRITDRSDEIEYILHASLDELQNTIQNELNPPNRTEQTSHQTSGDVIQNV